MMIKRVSGAGEVWLVYDVRDRLVLTQDSALRAVGQWLYTSYDSLNRPVLTGLWTSSYDRATQKSYADTSISWPNPGSGTYAILTRKHYDDYSWVSATGLSSRLITTNTSDTSLFYTASNTVFPYPRALTASNATRGMATGAEVNVLGTTTYLYSVPFYDDRGRVIQVHSTNNSGGKDTLTTQYGFTGRVLRVLESHGKGGVNPLSYQVLTKDFYDAAGRLTAENKKVGNSLEDTIAANSYNELGQLALKKLGKKRTSLTNFAYTTNPIDSLRYTYNIRGWLRGINKDYSNAANSAVNWFGMELNYDYGFTQGQFNGNISGIKWRNNSDGQQRAYGFSYDAVNRLTKADFTQYTSGSTWDISAGINFSVSGITYDQNGNILTMNQMGLKLNTSSTIDSLLYGYNSNSNKLNYVTDRTNDTTTLLADFKEYNPGTAPHYSYDGNGNLTADNNKRIANIHYNYLNLPDSVSFTGKGYIKYTYDAGGGKQQKTTIDNIVSKKTVTNYLGLFTYQYTTTLTGTGSDTLQFIGQEEGRIRPKSVGKSDTVFYDFFEKDHLGNTRVVLTDELLQDTYPAATLENNTAAFATEGTYYSINTADTIGTSRIASWGSTTGNNYPNNNGNPPYNNNPSANTSATSSVVYRLNGNTGDNTVLDITLTTLTRA